MTLRDNNLERLGPQAARAETPYSVYLCTTDVAELLVRIDEYCTNPRWRIATIDRTPSGEFYAFLTLFGDHNG